MYRLPLYFSLILFGNFGFSQDIEPIQADRPDQTETPSLVPKGMFQMENGFSFEKNNADSETITAPTSLWKYGITENFELRLITEFSHQTSDGNSISGLNPVLIGFKVKLTEERGIVPKMAFIGHLAVPKLASKEFQSTFYAPEFRFVMQHTLSEKFSFSYNLGAEWNGETPEPSFIYTTTLGFAASSKLGAFVELYGFAPQYDRADHRFDCGLTYLISNNFMIDLSGGFGITEHSPDYFVSTGFSFRI